jgi:hypothetical protein
MRYRILHGGHPALLADLPEAGGLVDRILRLLRVGDDGGRGEDLLQVVGCGGIRNEGLRLAGEARGGAGDAAHGDGAPGGEVELLHLRRRGGDFHIQMPPGVVGRDGIYNVLDHVFVAVVQILDMLEGIRELFQIE